jgi:hypothetical protein
MEDVMPGHPEKAAVNIRSGVAFRVTDVKAATRGIREHIQDIFAFFWGKTKILSHPERLILFPVVLPFFFNLIEGIFTHSEILTQRIG